MSRRKNHLNVWAKVLKVDNDDEAVKELDLLIRESISAGARAGHLFGLLEDVGEPDACEEARTAYYTSLKLTTALTTVKSDFVSHLRGGQ